MFMLIFTDCEINYQHEHVNITSNPEDYYTCWTINETGQILGLSCFAI